MEFPTSIEAAWGLYERPHRGPKPSLSLAQIVKAGVKIAESDGLPAVSMSRVAAELGTAPMSLYRYVPAKGELIDLMVDAVLGLPPEAASPASGWRESLSRWASAMRGVFHAHVWALRVPASGLPVRPNEVAWFEQGLACLSGTGLAEAQKASVIMLVSGCVRNEASTSIDIARAIEASGSTAGEWLAAYGRLLTRLAGPRRFPAISALVASGVSGSPTPPDDQFTFGLEFTFGLQRILDGIDVLLREQQSAAAAEPEGTTTVR